MFEKTQIQKVEIDQDKGIMYIYYVQDNSHLMSNPPPPPSYYREKYKFESLKLIEREDANVQRNEEIITYKSA